MTINKKTSRKLYLEEISENEKCVSYFPAQIRSSIKKKNQTRDTTSSINIWYSYRLE